MGEPATAFFGKTYDEAFALLVEARNYVAYEERGDRRGLDVFERLALSCETTRMTARLTHVMSWLLFQRAVHAGEIPLESPVPDELRLSGHGVCLQDGYRDDLPPRLGALLERSRKLYVRVARLDEMLGRA